MKELSIEEKAKAYDNIIEKANKMHSENCEACQMCIEELIPELRESEDERIRKALIHLVNSNKELSFGIDNYDGIKWSDILAWLEKQAQKPADKVEPKFKVGDTMRTRLEAAYGITGGMPVIISIDEEYYHCTNELIPIKDQDDYEYPPMNRIQPKQEWSEEDNERIEQICDDLKCGLEIFRSGKNVKGLHFEEIIKSNIDWLKSIKDRVQPKQEWNEDYISKSLEKCRDSYGHLDKLRIIDWLKSLRHQSQWKPTEREIHLLERIFDGKLDPRYYQASLLNIIRQLKKLKGE